jgi:hypothetical protein
MSTMTAPAPATTDVKDVQALADAMVDYTPITEADRARYTQELKGTLAGMLFSARG